MSPVSDYLEGVSLPLWEEMGLAGSLSLERAGFFPRGGGSLVVKFVSGTLQRGIQWEERGKLKGLWLSIVTSLLPKTVAERGRDTLLKELKGYGVPIAVELRDLESSGAGAAITLVAECEQGRAGFTSLGERGKPMERVALEAYRAFLKWYESKTSVDTHLADQLVLPAALVAERSYWTTPEVTEHLRTVLAVTQQFLPISFTITPFDGGCGRVEIVGTAIP
jgi:RNA 3'-terminal phosphate cyclase (ATP)